MAIFGEENGALFPQSALDVNDDKAWKTVMGEDVEDEDEEDYDEDDDYMRNLTPEEETRLKEMDECIARKLNDPEELKRESESYEEVWQNSEDKKKAIIERLQANDFDENAETFEDGEPEEELTLEEQLAELDDNDDDDEYDDIDPDFYDKPIDLSDVGKAFTDKQVGLDEFLKTAKVS